MMSTLAGGERLHKDGNVRRLLPHQTFIKPITEEGETTINQYRSGRLKPYHKNWGIPGLPESHSF